MTNDQNDNVPTMPVVGPMKDGIVDGEGELQSPESGLIPSNVLVPANSYVSGDKHDLVTESLKNKTLKQKYLKPELDQMEEPLSNAKKRLRRSASSDKASNQEFEYSIETLDIPAAKFEDPQTDNRSIDTRIEDTESLESITPSYPISGKDYRQTSPKSSPSTLIISGTGESAKIVVTVKAPLSNDDAAVTVPNSCQRLKDAIQAETSRIQDAIHGSSLPDQVETEGSDCNNQAVSESLVAAGGCSTSTDSDEDPPAKGPIRSKRPIDELTDRYSSDVSIPGTTVDVVEADRVRLIPSAIMPLKWKYVLLEELFMADEEWNQLPKQASPLGTNLRAEMTDTDFHNLVHHMYTRTVKKHYGLQAFKRMSLADKITLMKTNARASMVVHTSILHHWRQHKIMIDYPGCPVIADDKPKQFPNGIADRLWRFCATYPDKCRSDKSLTLILCAMALFDNDSDVAGKMDPISRGAFYETSRAYSDLLKEYLRDKYQELEARVGYQHLLSWLNCITLYATLDMHRADLDLDPLTFDVRAMRFSFVNIKK